MVKFYDLLHNFEMMSCNVEYVRELLQWIKKLNTLKRELVVPGKYYKKCAEMMDIYGYSIINLIKSLINNDEICYKIGMCFKDQNRGFVQLL